MPTDKPVKIVATDKELSVKPMKVKLKSKGEQVRWKCADGAVSILFNKDGSPFDPTNFPTSAGTDMQSGECAVTTNRPYRYTVVIYPTAGGSPLTIDPLVVVDDGGPPGGGGTKPRKGRKKARKGKK